MAVPGFQSFFKPLLEIAADGMEHSLKEAREKISENFKLNDEDKNERVPSGQQTKFDNRISWAKSYFLQAKLLDSSRRAHFKITERGKDLLAQNHEKISVKTLEQYPEFVEFHTASKQNITTKPSNDKENTFETPEEIFQIAYQKIQSDLAGEILRLIKRNSPTFFENLVIDLMVAMGYGGSRADAGQSVGQSGDEGIDGIIKEDRLGLDVIYLQAKRWEGTVGRPEIQKFVGALHGKRAKKGVFITTGKFSADANEYVKSIEPKVILIDGKILANFMIDFSLGTSTNVTYEIKRIDSDYFAEE